MNHHQNTIRPLLLTALFAFGVAGPIWADVAHVTPVDLSASAFGHVNAVMTNSSKGMATTRAESGCVGVYSPKPDIIVFHSVCQDSNAAHETPLPDNQIGAYSSKMSLVLTADASSESSSHTNPAVNAHTANPLLKLAVPQTAFGPFTTKIEYVSYESKASPQKTGGVNHHDGQGDGGGEGNNGGEGDGGGDNGDHDKDKDKHDKDDDDHVTPEPTTLLLVGTGICLLGGLLRRRLISA